MTNDAESHTSEGDEMEVASTMRAAVLPKAGADLELEELPVPEPGPGEVLVRVAGCGVCHTDLHVMKGEVAFPTPAVLGHEISGTVVKHGPGVTAPPLGTRVVASFIMPCGECRFCRVGRDDLCERFFAMNRLKGTLYDGTTRLHRPSGEPLAMYSMAGLAEYSVVPVTDVFPLPEGLPFADSSIFGCALFTAFGAVRNAARIQGGETCAVVAIGGVGLAVVQVLRASGAGRVIAVDVRDDKLEAATRLGATDVVNAASEEPVERVRALTGGDGVDCAFEVLGNPRTFEQALRMVSDGGSLVAVGIAPVGVTAAVEITHIVRRGIRIVGSYGARTRTDMPDLLRLAASGAIDAAATVSRHYPLEEAPQAYRALAEGDLVGRAVIEMPARVA